jgi:hypothetical protein
VYGLESLLHG